MSANIADIMTPEPITVDPDCPLDDAIRLFEQCGFRHLPVMTDGELLGMLSDRDVSLATGWILADHRKLTEGRVPDVASEIMRSPVMFVTTLDTPEDAGALFVSKKIGALPVLNGKKLVGILTETNLLKAFRDGQLETDLLGDGVTVGDCMTTQVSTLGPEDTLDDAVTLCSDNAFRHIPIIEDDELVGIISDRDLRFGIGQEILSDMSAQEEGRLEVARTPLAALMATDVISVDRRCSLGQAVDVMLTNRFSALPVVEGRRLLGIITPTDILKRCIRKEPA